jgi:phospholipase C
MATRRDFFIQAAQRTGAAGFVAALLAPVEAAAAIEAEAGSTYLDAEHVVILMQENRSFDHVFGSLRGVRGFDDPRAVTLPDGKPVWFQSNAAGETYAPFHLDIKETNATWLGSLPHSWRDQTDARNHGNNDGWLDAKQSGRKDCVGKPFTLGYYDRSDLPFYYALADAFTVCDQNFCSSLTGTTPNRLYFWTGTVRDKQDASSAANVRNSDVTEVARARWTTFPERLEDAGISWKIYQNELSVASGLSDEEDAWLANFTDNPIEWFEQFHVFYSKTFREHAAKAVATLPAEIAELERQIATGNSASLKRTLQSKQKDLKLFEWALATHTDESWQKLTPRERGLHERAFCTNAGDPAYRQLSTLRYRDGDEERTMDAPRGDVLFQFRKDVETGKLPAVSWIVPPERFSDHPGAPWYGAWMLSEVMRVLTRNPEVWKKTIFILTYDENDGYFDHVPPFGVPEPGKAESGKVSQGIDAGVEFWPLERDLEKRSKSEARGGTIGLGFRVPLIVASPWTRGGNVCSQVFDHTSILQLLEKLLSHKTGKPIRETNISAWRRTVCGDLSSVFQPASEIAPVKLDFPARDAMLRQIHQAKFKALPSGFRKVTDGVRPPRQESGVRPSLPLPYQLYAGGRLRADRAAIDLVLEARNEFFGARSAGAPFHVYAPGGYRKRKDLRTRAYAVAAGAQVADSWDLDGFDGGAYHLCVCGPNGFLRELKGGAQDPAIEVHCEYERRGDLILVVTNRDPKRAHRLQIAGNGALNQTVKAGSTRSIPVRLAGSFHWYDVNVKVEGAPGFERRFAGRVETGKLGQSDPAIGSASG